MGLLGRIWKPVLAIGSPIILIAIPACWEGGKTGQEPYAAYVIVLMSIYWMTECIPLPITAFAPAILYPLFGIASSDKVTSAYFQDSILFLFAGCVIALSFEYSNLHSRIALKVILLVGARIPSLLFGIMFTTMFLSMWMNNTSTTAMMVPIVSAIMEEFRKKMSADAAKKRADASGGAGPSQSHLEDTSASMEDVDMTTAQSSQSIDNIPSAATSTTTLEVRRISSTALDAVTEIRTTTTTEVVSLETRVETEDEVNHQIRKLRIMFLLGTAFASNIGGTGVITGSGTNVIALNIIRKDAEESYTPESCKPYLSISFLDWMLFNIPPMVINTIFLWLYMQIHFRGIPISWRFWRKNYRAEARADAELSNQLEKSIRGTMEKKYLDLGQIRFHELGVLILFTIIVILWVFKDPQIIPGWDAVFLRTKSGKSYISESTPTLLICVLLFTIPSKTIYYTEIMKGGLGAGLKDPLLSWSYIKEKYPWGIFLLLGGGSAMGVGAKESGLNAWIGDVLASSTMLKECPDAILLLILLFMIDVLTTVASNTACAAIVTPVLLGLSYAKGLHPLFLVMAATTVCSYAFVLPVSTPPNAIVYSSTDLKLTDMMLPGFIVSIVTILILFVCTLTTGSWLLAFGSYANECGNMTLAAI